MMGCVLEDRVRLTILSKGRPGDEGDSVLLAVVKQVVPFAVSEAIAVLDRNDGDDFSCALKVFKGDVR